jgi:6-phosphogluconolactonase/glucosamine-6-phosphate isomerase/deaminase
MQKSLFQKQTHSDFNSIRLTMTLPMINHATIENY